MTEEDTLYIDYESFLDADFSPSKYANTLVIATNNASDATIDLATPLSKVLFDIQEVDTHIHNIATKSAIPLITHVQKHYSDNSRILNDLEAQVKRLNENYQRLEKEIIARYETAEETRVMADNLLKTTRIARAANRCLNLGRQVELQTTNTSGKSEDANHEMSVRSSRTILAIRKILSEDRPGQDGHDLLRLNSILALRNDVISPIETRIRMRAQQVLREFSLQSTASANGQIESDAKSSTNGLSIRPQKVEETTDRTASACLVLYLLSPVSPSASGIFRPNLLIASLEAYLSAALSSSLAAIVRGLTNLTNLPRALYETSARCRNIVGLEALLQRLTSTEHPFIGYEGSTQQLAVPSDLLEPLLTHLDTSSVPSYFWRSLASSVSPRVSEILSKGGAVARQLRGSKEKLRDSFRDAVLRGTEGVKHRDGTNWERESSVMISSVLGPLAR